MENGNSVRFVTEQKFNDKIFAWHRKYCFIATCLMLYYSFKQFGTPEVIEY